MDNNVVAYIIEDGPFIYVGEMVEQDKIPLFTLALTRVLLRVLNPKDRTISWAQVPCVGKDSLVLIDMKVVRGVLVKNIDSDDLNEYRVEASRIYSKPTLA